ncbi:MAG: nucleotidyltransferase substrate binding protein [Myxococcales bacterium]|nr:nucleotidyltransferase substrate binding protein [Myxococcales bacterium]
MNKTVPLNTDHLQRCIQTLEAALTMYHQAEAGGIQQEVFRNAVVKGFELVQETSFKLLKRALSDYGHGARALESLPIKELLRLAATHGLLSLPEVERWFAYRDNRNDTAHDYGQGFAEETLVLLPDFVADVKTLKSTLTQRFGES